MNPQAFTAHTTEQARLLLSEDSLKTLGPLVAATHCASEVARLSGVPLKRTHHFLTRLVGAGLVEVAGEQPRSGRPMKLYRAVAPSFRVPFALTPHATMEELLTRMTSEFMAEVSRELARLFAGEAGTELVIAPSELGRLATSVAPRHLDAAPPYGALGNLVQTRLTPHTQRELEVRLRDLLTWLNAQATADQNAPEAQPCLVGLMFTPVREAEER